MVIKVYNTIRQNEMNLPFNHLIIQKYNYNHVMKWHFKCYKKLN